MFLKANQILRTWRTSSVETLSSWLTCATAKTKWVSSSFKGRPPLWSCKSLLSSSTSTAPVPSASHLRTARAALISWVLNLRLSSVRWWPHCMRSAMLGLLLVGATFPTWCAASASISTAMPLSAAAAATGAEGLTLASSLLTGRPSPPSSGCMKAVDDRAVEALLGRSRGAMLMAEELAADSSRRCTGRGFLCSAGGLHPALPMWAPR
mmetsp:Transcript_89258/g.253101  ORF Transcript_89258/g.253101 Transcript_89258/m.253101 type:complete len:209 (-) Transcript_89258:959-1585(-)